MATYGDRGYLQVGPSTLKVPLQLFAENRRRLVQKLAGKTGVVLLQGGDSQPLYNTDVTYEEFRQEPFFQWAFGVRDPGCFGVIRIDNGNAILFVPRLPSDYAIWMGPLRTLEDFKTMYKVERVAYVDEMKNVLKEIGANSSSSPLFILKGTNTDSKLTTADIQFHGIDEFAKDYDTLYPIITECSYPFETFFLTVTKKNVEINFSEKMDQETDEIIKGLEECYTTKGVFNLLEVIPAEEVTPEVALQALKTLVRIDSNCEFRNKFPSLMMSQNEDNNPKNFTRNAVLNKLLALISEGSTTVLLDGLHVICRDTTIPPKCLNGLCEEVLLRVSEGSFTVAQVCQAVRAYMLLGWKKQAEKLWVGILKEGDVNVSDVMEVVRVLPYLRLSRRLLLGMLETRLEQVWTDLRASDAIEILDILQRTDCNSPRITCIVSGWLSTNIHRIAESDLLQLVKAFSALPYRERGVQQTLERYVKAKGLKIKNAAVLSAIMDYCKKFRIRSPLLFNGCAEYIVHHSKTLQPSDLAALFIPFGTLDFHPTHNKFWLTFEEVLADLFPEMQPSDALDVMLTCLFLEKFPLNFVNKVFNAYFLDRLHSVPDSSQLLTLRRNLKILDAALTLECKLYKGPLLPRDHSAKSIWQDNRIRRATMTIIEPLQNIFGSKGFISPFVVLSQFPLSEIYIVDLLIHRNPLPAPYLNVIEPQSSALLIHVPEHYDCQGEHLIGIQNMRSRHLRQIGLSVIHLNANFIYKLRVHPKQLEEYLYEQIGGALESPAS